MPLPAAQAEAAGRTASETPECRLPDGDTSEPRESKG